jgi:hypothetical protein
MSPSPIPNRFGLSTNACNVYFRSLATALVVIVAALTMPPALHAQPVQYTFSPGSQTVFCKHSGKPDPDVAIFDERVFITGSFWFDASTTTLSHVKITLTEGPHACFFAGSTFTIPGSGSFASTATIIKVFDNRNFQLLILFNNPLNYYSADQVTFVGVVDVHNNLFPGIRTYGFVTTEAAGPNPD